MEETCHASWASIARAGVHRRKPRLSRNTTSRAAQCISPRSASVATGLDITLPDTALCCRRFGAIPVPRNGKNMASSVWSGYLTFGLISMPVRLFSGARSNHISFNMLHRDDNARLKQQLWCPHDERVVERNEIVKGYEYRKGEYVIIEPDEIKKIEPKDRKSTRLN